MSKEEEFFRAMREKLAAPKSYLSYNDVERKRLRESIRRKKGIAGLGGRLTEEEQEFLTSERAINKEEDNMH